jgi:hypothetical protein
MNTDRPDKKICRYSKSSVRFLKPRKLASQAGISERATGRRQQASHIKLCTPDSHTKNTGSDTASRQSDT